MYSIGLWICLPWDFCASSWDHEIVLKTMRLERSALGWGEGCPMLLQIYAWHCIVMKIMYQSTRIKNKKYNEKLNKAMHKFFGVLDKYGWGEEDMYVPTLNFQILSFPILRRSRPCSFARLVLNNVHKWLHMFDGTVNTTHVAISSSIMLLFQGHVAKKMCNNRLHICVKLLRDLRY